MTREEVARQIRERIDDMEERLKTDPEATMGISASTDCPLCIYQKEQNELKPLGDDKCHYCIDWPPAPGREGDPSWCAPFLMWLDRANRVDWKRSRLTAYKRALYKWVKKGELHDA